MSGFFSFISPASGATSSPAFSIEHNLARMRTLAHRMLSRYPHLRRFENTSDRVHNAVIRLDRAMQSEALASPPKRHRAGRHATQS